MTERRGKQIWTLEQSQHFLQVELLLLHMRVPVRVQVPVQVPVRVFLLLTQMTQMRTTTTTWKPCFPKSDCEGHPPCNVEMKVIVSPDCTW